MSAFRGQVPNLVLAQRVIDKMAAAASRYIQDETGEAMIGLIDPGTHTNGVPTLYVLDTIAPDESDVVREYYSFEQGDDLQFEIFTWYLESWGIWRQMLKSGGLTVIHVQSGSEALASLAKSRNVDLVLTDVMMPGMNGVDLALAIRKSWPGLPVVLTTGYVEAARSAMTEGLDVLVKPYSPETLANKLRAHLSKRAALAL